jgi:hypothetical protein
MPKKRTVLTARAFPDFPDHVRIRFREGVAVNLRADEDFRVPVATQRIVDDAIADSVGPVAGSDGCGGGSGEFGFRHERFGVHHHNLRPENGRNETMPVDRRTTGHDAVVIFGETLRLHQTLASTGGPANEIGVARRFAVEGLRERFAHNRHVMDTEIGIVADRLPVEPAILVECEFATTPFMAGVRSAGRITLGGRTTQGAGMASQESAATIATKSSVPIRYGECDEDFDAIA